MMTEFGEKRSRDRKIQEVNIKDRRLDKKKKHAGRKPKISAISPKEVSRLVADGYSPREIAERMGVSIATYYRRFPANKK